MNHTTLDTNPAVNAPAVNWPLAIRAVVAPAIVWACLVGFATLGGYPGVVCITPLAILVMPLWAGLFYARGRGATPSPLPGAAVVGLLLGLIMGGVFIFGSAQMMAAAHETRASEIALNRNLSIGMAIGSVVCSTLVCVLAARFASRR